MTPGLLLAYDINCQYCIHFRDRMAAGPHLTIQEELEVTYLIGLFHVHGHKEDCLPKFASTFAKGAGMTSGEIIESLWSILNGIGGITRTMTLAHRQELINACIGDINWKKLQGMGRSILQILLPVDGSNSFLVSEIPRSAVSTSA